MSSVPEDDAPRGADRGLSQPLPGVVDWLVAGAVALVGLLSLVFGSALAFVVDRELVTDAVARGDLRFQGIADADGIEVVLALATWTAAGLLVTGVATVLAGVAYLVYARRVRRRAAAGGPANFFIVNAALGAVASALLSFLPFSPAIGGALAGYLERHESGRSLRVGAVSGALSVAPALLLAVFFFGGLVAGLLAIDASGLAIVAGTGVPLTLVLVPMFGAGLGALGGYAGGWLAGGPNEG